MTARGLTASAVALCALLAGGAGPATQTPLSGTTATEAPLTPEQTLWEWTSLQFPKEVHAARRAALAAALPDDRIFLAPSLDGFSSGETFRQLDDFLYFTGLELPNSVLAVHGSGEVILFVPPTDARFENPSRRNDFPGRKLGLDSELSERSGVADIRPVETLIDAVEAWGADGAVILVNTGRRFEPGTWVADPLHQPNATEAFALRLSLRLPELRLESGLPVVAARRMIKGAEEIARLRRAAEITAQGLRVAAMHVRAGIDERGLEAEFEAELKRQGAQRLAFDSIIKSGPNSLWPWRILALALRSPQSRARRRRAGDLRRRLRARPLLKRRRTDLPGLR